jgi:hypothetical protein
MIIAQNHSLKLIDIVYMDQALLKAVIIGGTGASGRVKAIYIIT